MQPPRVFLKWPQERSVDRARILHSEQGIFCATFDEFFFLTGQVRPRSYDALSQTTSGLFVTDIACSAYAQLVVFDWNRDIIHDLGQNMTISDLSKVNP